MKKNTQKKTQKKTVQNLCKSEKKKFKVTKQKERNKDEFDNEQGRQP